MVGSVFALILLFAPGLSLGQEATSPENNTNQNQEQGNRNTVNVSWDSSIEMITNTNVDNPSEGIWFIQFGSQGLITRERTETVYLTIDQMVGTNPKKNCTYGPEYGLSFSVLYPSCATQSQTTPQTLANTPVFESGMQYYVYFTDAEDTILNNVYSFNAIPGSSSESGSNTNTGNTSGNNNSSNGSTGTNNSSNASGNNSVGGLVGSGASIVSNIFANGIVPDCGYDIKTRSYQEGTGRACGLADLIILIQNIIEYIFILILPIAAIVFVYVGYLYLTSGGDAAKHTRAKQAMTSLVIGVVIILAAWLLIKIVLQELGVDTGISEMFLDLTT